MKKIISKILIIFIIIVMLFEFTYSNNISYAFDSEDINSITNVIGGIMSILLWIPRIKTVGIAWTAGKILTESFAESCGISDDECFKNQEESWISIATPFDIFFNKYKIFDIDLFDFSISPDGETKILYNIRTQVAQWFYVLRTIAAAVLLCILIYVGIRMALSTIADEKAKYKKMLYDWACSLALIFVLQYIAIFTIEVNNIIVDFLREAIWQQTPEAVDSSGVMGKIAEQAMLGMGISSIVATIVFCMMVYQTVCFMIAYLQRMLKVGFLILISPLISITYSIDKIGDGKAQALDKWLKEFVYTVLTQPFHCIIYYTFVVTAMKLLVDESPLLDSIGNLFDGGFNHLANGVIVILCIKFISDGERAIKKIFNFQDDDSMTSMAAGAAIGMAALSNAKKIGQTAGKGFNKAKSFSTKFQGAIAKDKAGALGKLTGKFNDKIKSKLPMDKLNKVKGGFDKVSNAITNNPVAQKIQKAGKFVGGKAAKFKEKADALKAKKDQYFKNHPNAKKWITGAKTLSKKSTSMALGMMAASMYYASGSGSAAKAMAMYSGMSQITAANLESSENTLTGDGADYAEQATDADVENDENVQKAKSALEENEDNVKEARENLAGIAGLSRDEKKHGEKYLAVKDERAKTADEIAKWQQKRDSKEGNQEEVKQKLRELHAKERALKKQENKMKREHPEFSKARELYDKKHESENTIEAHKALEANLKEARTQARINGISQLKYNGSDVQIAKAKSDILKAIQKCKMEQKSRNSETDSNSDYRLNEDETSDSGRMQRSICDLLDRDIMNAGGAFDARKFVSNNFGDPDSEMARNLYAAIDAYQYQKNAQLYNQTRSNAASLGVDEDRFDSQVAKKVTGRNG